MLQRYCISMNVSDAEFDLYFSDSDNFPINVKCLRLALILALFLISVSARSNKNWFIDISIVVSGADFDLHFMVQ